MFMIALLSVAQIASLHVRALPNAKVAPALKPVPAKSAPTEETVELTHIPPSMLKFGSMAGWIIKRAPAAPQGSIPPAVTGVYVELTRLSTPGWTCTRQNYVAAIDLRPIRANGFRLVEYWYEPVPEPKGYAADGANRPRHAISDNLERLESLDVGAYVLARTSTPDLRIPRPCWSAFHVRLKGRGPAGVNPVTGGRTGHAPPVH